MFSEKIYSGKKVEFDNEGRLRMDDFELGEDVQNKVDFLWDKITPENFAMLSDYEGYRLLCR